MGNNRQQAEYTANLEWVEVNHWNLRRGGKTIRNWTEARALTAPPMAFPCERFPFAEAMIAFRPVLGAAQTGDIASAEAQIAELQALEQKLAQNKDDYWAEQVEIQRLAAWREKPHALFPLPAGGEREN